MYILNNCATYRYYLHTSDLSPQQISSAASNTLPPPSFTAPTWAARGVPSSPVAATPYVAARQQHYRDHDDDDDDADADVDDDEEEEDSLLDEDLAPGEDDEDKMPDEMVLLYAKADSPGLVFKH